MRPPLRIHVMVLLASCLGAASARPATVSYVASVPLQTTNWSTTLDFPRFDPALGTLMSVAVEVRDSLVHKVEYENLSTNSSSRFRDSAYVEVDVMRPASTSLLTAYSAVYETATVGVYDGLLDYAGTSGATFDGLVGYTTWSSTTSTPADLALFTGTGSVSLPCQASAWFLFSYTAGNAHYQLTTQAQAYVIVTYTYDMVTPASRTTWGAIKNLYQ